MSRHVTTTGKETAFDRQTQEILSDAVDSRPEVLVSQSFSMTTGIVGRCRVPSAVCPRARGGKLPPRAETEPSAANIELTRDRLRLPWELCPET